MAKITLEGSVIETVGNLPKVGGQAPGFLLTSADMNDVSLADYSGKNIILNIFVSIDTGICASSVRRFNEEASQLENSVVLCVSADLPFALGRFCGAEGLDNVIPLSSFRSPGFGNDYGITVTTGPLRGLLARSIVVIDSGGRVIYTEQVPEIAQEPDYAAALEFLR